MSIIAAISIIVSAMSVVVVVVVVVVVAVVVVVVVGPFVRNSYVSTLRPVVIHPVSVRRFPSFRTQPLEDFSVDSVNKSLEQPSPWRKSSKRKSCYGGRV